MGLDVRFKQLKDVTCPHCGQLVRQETVEEVYSGGRVWYDFLELIGYYVPYNERTPDNDYWYGKDMALTPEEARAAYDFAKDNEVYEWDAVCGLIADAFMENHHVVVNADW